MCVSCETNLHVNRSSAVLVSNANNIDPTQTTTLRNAFAREMRRRFQIVARLVALAIVEKDVFGLKNSSVVTNATIPNRGQFDFPRSSQKVNEFMNWLRRQIQDEILEVTDIAQVGNGINGAWTNKYITDSYRRAVLRAQYNLKKKGYDIPEGLAGIKATLSAPLHIDALGLLYTRTFSDLKGITDAMDGQISRVLTQGLADGDNPLLLARKINQVIKTGGGDLGLQVSYINPNTGKQVSYFMPASRRAEILARTEIIRAHAEATLQEYANWRVEGVTVKAEWITAQDNRVCPLCQALEGQTFTIEEARGLLPRHPQCRCAWIPAG